MEQEVSSEELVSKLVSKAGEIKMWDMPENWLIQTTGGDCGLGAGTQVLVGIKYKGMSCLDMGTESL